MSEKCDIATRLSLGEVGGGYAESAIIVCSALSALSAELWSGRQIDRVRFIEMLTRIGPSSIACQTVSIPLLVEHFRSTNQSAVAHKLQQAFSLPSSARVVTGPDVDRGETDVLPLVPQLKLKELRQFSYASILYGEIRTSYAHEYRPGVQADSWPMTMLADQRVSYINRMTDDQSMRRLVHIHIEWVRQVAVEIASAIDRLVVTLPLPKPKVWWADGG